MQHAFVERLKCGDHLIVRAGPLAKAYGDPYERACVGEIDGEAVTLMGFESPLGTLPMAVFRAAVRALKSDGFKQVHLDRLTANPRRLVFIQGDEEGKIIMKRHHPREAQNADGSYDLKAAEAHAQEYVNAIKSGDLVIQPNGLQQVISADGDLIFTMHAKFKK